MKRKLPAGETSVTLPILVFDSTSGSGAGLAGLVFNTASLVAEYRRENGSSWTAITLVAGTLGTYISGGFVADGELDGAYEFCPPNACFASGKRWVAIRLRGATDMKAVLMEFELDAVNYQDAAAFGLSRIDAAISTRSTYAGGAVASVTAPVSILGPFKINTAAGFEVAMVSSSDHSSGYTGGSVTATREIAGAGTTTAAGTVTQVGSTNRYYFSGTSADFNGTSVAFTFSATGADPITVSINTTP